jgi:hypothetical protein
MNPLTWMTRDEWIFAFLLCFIIYGIGLAPRVVRAVMGGPKRA